MNNTVKNGLIIGLLTIVIDLLFSGGGPAGFLQTVVLVLGIYYTHHQYKNVGDGFMTYGKGLSLGMAIALFAGVVAAIYYYVSFSLDQQLIEEVLNEVAYSFEAQDMDNETFDVAMGMAESVVTPLGLAISSFVYNLILGLVASLIISIFTKKDNDTLEV